MRTALSLIAWVAAHAIVNAPALAQGGPPRSADLAEATRLIVAGSNEFRRAEGAAAMRPDAQLTAAARSFASFMARTDRYGHEADGKKPAARAEEHGYRYCIVLENIASLYHSEGFDTQELAERVLHGWKQSPGHRKNLLDRDVTDIGVAIAQSAASGKHYAVQMFGRPQSKRIEFQIANASPAAIDYELDGQSFSLPPRVTRMHRQCRNARVTVHWPDGRPPATVEPADGERYEIERAGSQYRLRKG
jgi:uncharacterized protein YkwD